jgi:WHG domain-containing protein
VRNLVAATSRPSPAGSSRRPAKRGPPIHGTWGVSSRCAVAVRAAELLGKQLDREAASGTPAQRLAAAARAYVRFASDQRPLFQALAGAGLDKSRHPEIERAAQAVGMAFLSPAARLVNGGETAAARLTSAIVATAHGHAMLMLDGTFGSGHHAAGAAAEQAAAATLALIAGWSL